MGNSEPTGKLNPGILQYIQEEVQRVSGKPDGPLRLSEVLEVQPHEDFPFDFRHLGILFVCDKDKDGVFSLQDLQAFASWVQLKLASVQMYEFRSQLQARTVALIIEELDKKGGQQLIVEWFLRALTKDKTPRTIRGNIYLKIEAVKLVYEIFSIKVMSDLDIQTFFYLVKKSSEELGSPIEQVKEHAQDEDFEEYIHIEVCREFVVHFLKGATKILKEVGYTPTIH